MNLQRRSKNLDICYGRLKTTANNIHAAVKPKTARDSDDRSKDPHPILCDHLDTRHDTTRHDPIRANPTRLDPTRCDPSPTRYDPPPTNLTRFDQACPNPNSTQHDVGFLTLHPTRSDFRVRIRVLSAVSLLSCSGGSNYP